jgi:hypothetical protein
MRACQAIQKAGNLGLEIWRGGSQTDQARAASFKWRREVPMSAALAIQAVEKSRGPADGRNIYELSSKNKEVHLCKYPG